MTKLEGEQKLRRVVRIYGVGDVEVTLSTEGIKFRVPGTRSFTTLPWARAVERSLTPPTVKSYYMDRPTEFLRTLVEGREKRNAENL